MEKINEAELYHCEYVFINKGEPILVKDYIYKLYREIKRLESELEKSEKLNGYCARMFFAIMHKLGLKKEDHVALIIPAITELKQKIRKFEEISVRKFTAFEQKYIDRIKTILKAARGLPEDRPENFDIWADRWLSGEDMSFESTDDMRKLIESEIFRDVVYIIYYFAPFYNEPLSDGEYDDLEFDLQAAEEFFGIKE